MMMKILIGIIGLVVALCAIFLAADYKIESHLKVPEPIIVETNTPPIKAPISTIHARAEVPIKEIERLVNAKVPKSLSGSQNNPTSLLNEDVLRWKATISKITVVAVNGGLRLNANVVGSVNIKGRFGVKRKNKGPLGWLESISSVSVSESGKIGGKLTGYIRPSINPDWTINPNLAVTVNITKAKVKLVGNTIPISLKGIVQGKVDKQVSKLSKKLTAQLNKKAIIKNEMLKLWDEAHIVKILNKAPNVWLALEPEQIGAQMITENNKLIVNVITKVSSSINIQNEMPKKIMTTLPPPARFDGGKNDFSIVVPIIANFNDFNIINLEELGIDNTIETDAAKIKITNVKLFGDSNKLFISANTQSDIEYVKRVNAKIFLSGEPVFDDNFKILNVKNIQYDVKTRNLLLGVADFLLEDIFLKKLEELAQFNLNIGGESVTDLANREVAKLLSTLPSSIKPSLGIDDTGISELFIEDGRLIAMVHANGTASVKFTSLDQLFK